MSEDIFDVVVLGAGVAGATAAYGLRGCRMAIVEKESWIGGRTRSEIVNKDLWINLGAQYISEDKVTIFRLADELGLSFIPFNDSALAGHFLPDYLNQDDVREIREITRRLQQERRRERQPDDPTLDGISFEEWLGEIRPNVRRYWEMWCSVFSGPARKVSLYGVLLMYGLNRVSAFAASVPVDKRGHSMIVGGTAELARALVKASGAEVLTSSPATNVIAGASGGYRVQVRTPEGARELVAEKIVCALPAPHTLELIPWLPEWKCRALSAITYGRIISTPVVVGPEGYVSQYAPKADFNPGKLYTQASFGLRAATDFDRIGTFFMSSTYDDASRAIWEESDDAIRAGVYHAFVQAHPNLKGRVMDVRLQRWLNALPQYTPGRMKATPELIRPVDNIHFCGDHTDLTHTEGAARSGERVAREIAEARRASGQPLSKAEIP